MEFLNSKVEIRVKSSSTEQPRDADFNSMLSLNKAQQIPAVYLWQR